MFLPRVIPVIFFVFIFGSIVRAETFQIEMQKNGESREFSVEIARIDIGDTVEWLPVTKGHNIEFRMGPEGSTLPKKSKLSQPVEVKFDVPGVYFYWCTPHKSMGMIGLVVVGNDTSNLEEISKAFALGESKKKLQELIKPLI